MYANGFLHRKKITINEAYVIGSSDFTDHPFWYITQDNNLRTQGNGGHVMNVNGYDMIFTKLDGTVLNHEVEKYDATTGQFMAWVKVPTIDYDANTEIYLYYGKSSISTSQENITGTWNSGYKGVWHLRENPLGDVQIDGTPVHTDASDTLSITIASNSNRVLIVCFGTHQGNTPSGITHNGVAMTKIKEQIGSFNEQVSIWGLAAPDTGTHDIVVSGESSYFAISAYSLYNADQTLPSGADAVAATGSSASASVSITPSSNKRLIIDCATGEDNLTMTTTGGTNDSDEVGASYENVASSHFQQTTAAAKTMSYSLASGQRWNIVAVAVSPAANTILDSTSNNYDMNAPSAAAAPSQVDGPLFLNKGLSFDGSDDYLINTAWASIISGNGARTIEAWFYDTSFSNQNWIAWGAASGNNLSSMGDYGGSIGYTGYGNDHLYSGSGYTSAWHHMVISHDGTTLKVIIDGVERVSDSTSLNTSAAADLYFGRYVGGAYYSGRLAEIRISDSARGPDYATTIYNNMYNPRAFFTDGPEESYLDLRNPGSNGIALSTIKALTETGTGSDAISVDTGGSTPKNVTDTGAGTDTPSVAARVPITDTGAGSDTPTVRAAVPITDTGSGNDSPSVRASIPLTDTGTGVDAILIQALIAIIEEGAGYFMHDTFAGYHRGTLKANATILSSYIRLTQAINDQNGQVEYSGDLSESFEVNFEYWSGGGNGADAVYFYWGCSSTPTIEEDSDCGGFEVAIDEYNADTIQLWFNGASLASVSFGAPVDDSTWRTVRIKKVQQNIKVYVGGSLFINYTGNPGTPAGTLYGFGARTGGLNNEHRVRSFTLEKEQVEVSADIPVSDTGSGADALSVAARVPITDTGTGADVASKSAAGTVVNVSDDGSGADALTIRNAFTILDSAVGADVLAILARLTMTDNGSGADTPSVRASVPITDQGTGAETATVRAAIPVQDSGVGAETPQVRVRLTVSDLGTASDVLSVLAGVSVQDSGSGLDAVAIRAIVSLADQGVGAEVLQIAAALGITDSGSGADIVAVVNTIRIAESGIGADEVAVINLNQPFQRPAVLVVTKKATVLVDRGKAVVLRNEARSVTLSNKGNEKTPTVDSRKIVVLKSKW